MDATSTAPQPKRQLGVLGLLLKLGGKFFGVLLKLLKTLKFGKLALFGASFGAYSLMWNWKFAAVLLGSLFLHEMGHLWAMRRYGLKTKGVYFIPLLGAAAVSEDRFPSRKAETVIALMGPLWGFGLALATFGGYVVTDAPVFAALAGWMAMINLFNLLPINPLDGGRVMKSIAYSVSSRLGVLFLAAGLAGGFLLAHRFGLGLMTFLLLIGSFELLGEIKRVRRVQDRTRVLAALGAALGVAPEPEAVIARIAKVQAHLARGETGMFPPRLLDEDPYTGRFSPREWVSYFQARVSGAAGRARIERRHLLTRRPYMATSSGQVACTSLRGDFAAFDDASPLCAFLRDAKDAMPAMTPVETAAGFAAYAALAVALAALMFATAHIPAAQAALGVFMG